MIKKKCQHWECKKNLAHILAIEEIQKGNDHLTLRRTSRVCFFFSLLQRLFFFLNLTLRYMGGNWHQNTSIFFMLPALPEKFFICSLKLTTENIIKRKQRNKKKCGIGKNP